MKRLLIALIAVFVVLTGCGSNNQTESKPQASNTPAESKQSTEQIVLDFPTYQANEPGFKDWWEGLIEDYGNKYPEARVEMTYVPNSNFINTLMTRFAANDAPDIIMLPSNNFIQIASDGWLAPLDTFMAQTDIPDTWSSLQSQMQLEGSTYGLVLLGHSVSLYYNEKMLKDAGLDVPSTPQQLIDAAKALTKDGVFGFGMTTTTNPNVYNDAAYWLIGQGQHWLDENGNYKLTQPEVVQAFDTVRQLYNYSPEGLSPEQYRQMFFDGKVAMIIDGPWVYAMKETANPEIAEHVQVAPPPFKVYPGRLANNLSLPESIPPEKKEWAWKFIELAASPEWQRKYAELTQNPPAMKDVLTPDIYDKYPQLKVFSDLSKDAVNIMPPSENIMKNYNEFSNLIQDAMMRMMTTKDSTEAILTDLQNQLNAKVAP